MKLLFVHSDLLEFEAKKPALPSVPPLAEDRRFGRVEEALVVFFAVEKGDEKDVEGSARLALREIQDVSSQVKAKRIVLYPYAHLSSDLSSPTKAKEAGEILERLVRGAGFEVLSAPFGYYKSFKLHAKGHPLSELSRSVSISSSSSAPRESAALTSEKRLRSSWYVLTPQGELTPAEEFDFSEHENLKALFEHETRGTRRAQEEPPHVKLMREMELVDYEPGSDAGNFRWYPKGQLVKRLLETRVSDLVQGLGGMRVETPIMYDFDHPALSKYLDRFPARQYTVVSDDKEYFLRFAACFGQYLIMHDMTISYRNLPLRIYELTHYSFRREQSGELAGLRRLRAFTMPDMHTLVADVQGAKEEFQRQFEASMTWMSDLGVPYEAAVRFVRSFFEENREWATTLSRLLGRPILVEIWEERFFYFVMKFEFNVVDSQGKASALSTVQIDVENSERFDISYVDENGNRVRPLLLHASLSGSIDRNLYALLENESIRIRKGGKGRWPFWLAPTQIRIIPVSDDYIPQALEVARHLSHRGIRVDVDDREHGVARKVRDAEKEWVPALVVLGEREAKSDRLPVRFRDGHTEELTPEELGDWAEHEIGERPRIPLPLPLRIRERPVFRG